MSDAGRDGLRAAIADVYGQLRAPDWAAPNLDGLADVLRDLGWLPPGPVTVRVPAAAGADLARLVTVLVDAERDSAGGERPVRVLVG